MHRVLSREIFQRTVGINAHPAAVSIAFIGQLMASFEKNRFGVGHSFESLLA